MSILMGKSVLDTDFETAGHAAVCHELIELVKPDNQSFMWYQPDLPAEGGRHLQLDFLLYAP